MDIDQKQTTLNRSLRNLNQSCIILLRETKVYKNTSIKIEGYQVFLAVRQTKQGGGLAFVVRNKYCPSPMIDKGDNAEFLNVRLTMKGCV